MGRKRKQSAKTATKRQKPIEEEEEEDRISGLPQAIILHILSFLLAEDAIKTGLLSKRWKYLWTHAPNLDFRLGGSSDYDGFFGFIDKTLILYSSDKINKFGLEFDYPDVPPTATATLDSRVSLWLRFASIRQVEVLVLELLTSVNANGHPDLDSDYPPRYVMPNFVYDTTTSLTRLYSRCCDYPPLAVGQHVCWGLLKELVIADTQFQDGVLQMMLLGSPLLEDLRLWRCRGLPNNIDTSNIRLKILCLVDLLGADLEISIPTVESLQILGDCYGSRFKLLNVSSLVEARFDFQLQGEVSSVVPECCHWVWQLFERVNHVEKLTVGMWCIQVLSESLSKALRPPLLRNENCKCLTLATWFERRDFHGVASLLHSSPNLEELVVNNATGFSAKPNNFNYSTENDYWTSQARSFHCLERLLKTIRIVGLAPAQSRGEGRLVYDNDGLLEFIKFLLASARVLEKLVILAPRGTDWKMDNYYSIAQKLLTFPRSSPRAVVLLPE